MSYLDDELLKAQIKELEERAALYRKAGELVDFYKELMTFTQEMAKEAMRS